MSTTDNTPKPQFSTLDLSNFLSSVSATRTASTKTSVPTHDLTINPADLCDLDNFRPLVPTAFVTPLVPVTRKLAHALKTDSSRLAVTHHVSISVHAKTYALHVTSPSHVHARKTSDFDTLVSLSAPKKIANVNTTRHPRHQHYALLTPIDVASLLSCFASYLPADLNNATVHTARAFVSDTINCSHTHYSFIHLAHVTASVFAKLHKRTNVYAPVFNTIMTAFNMSDDKRMINSTHDDYPPTVINHLASIINPSDDNPDQITLKHDD